MTPVVTLVVTFVALLFGLLALFLGLAVTLQRLFDAAPGDKLPLRALVAALGMALFLTGWTYLNTRAAHEDKYGALHEFKATSESPIESFDAVRRLRFKENGNYREQTTPYILKNGEFVDKTTGKKFLRNSSDFITIAIIVPHGNEPLRLEADTKDFVYIGQTENNSLITFRSKSSSQSIDEAKLNVLQTESVAGLVLVLVVNVLHFALWFVAFWPVMQFRVGMSMLLTCLFGGVSMFILVPLLFESNAVKPVPVVANP